MQPDKLVMMANQIAAFFLAQGEARAVPQIAKHIEDFWDPRMRQTILAHVAAGGAGLDPLALVALKTLKPVAAAAPPPGAP
jgi:formate dehydrogenase subunit delta